jgi:hypothetical protein
VSEQYHRGEPGHSDVPREHTEAVAIPTHRSFLLAQAAGSGSSPINGTGDAVDSRRLATTGGRPMRRIVVALPIAALFVMLSVTMALAKGASVTITNLICPTGYGGTNYAADCTSVPDPSLPFEISGPASASGQTDTAGTVIFEGLPAGTYTVTGGVPGEFAEAVIECQGQESISQDGVILTLEIAADAAVTCSWWNIPEDLSGKPPNTAVATGQPDGSVLLGMLMVLLSISMLAKGAARPTSLPRA